MMRVYSLALLLFVGCADAVPSGDGSKDGTNTGNGLLSLQFALISSGGEPNVNIVSTDEQGTLLNISSVAIAAERIDILLPLTMNCDDSALAKLDTALRCTEPEAGDDDGSRIEVDGPFVFDFLGNTVSQPVEITLPFLVYRGVNLLLAPADPADGLVNPLSPLANQTLTMAGDFAYESPAIPFSAALAFEDKAQFEEASSFEVSAQTNEVSLLLNAASWFADIPLTQCLDDGELNLTDGDLIITNGTGDCSDVDSKLAEAFSDSTEFDED